MATGFYGADVQQLRDLANQISSGGVQLTSIESVLSGTLSAAPWIGPDAQQFTNQWNGQLRLHVRSTAAALDAAATAIRLQAQQQETASTDVGGWSGPGSGVSGSGSGFASGSGGSGNGPAIALASFDPTNSGGQSNTSETTADGKFTIGPPIRPEITWDEGFVYNSKDAGFSDWVSKEWWLTKADTARLVRWDLDDGLDAYAHYWDNTGEPYEIDLQEACDEDASIQKNVDSEIASAQSGADELIQNGNTSFSFSGGASAAGAYPETENWQKAIGAYQQWSSGDVTVVGDKATMVVTVNAEDYYNFNPGQSDIASGASDDENGRFTEIGWAKPFETSGSVTRTVTWTVGDPASVTVVEESGGR